MKIVIIGCGFAGLSAAETLSRRIDADITLIDRKEYFENLALLPEILSGKVNTSDVTGDIRKFAKRTGANFIVGEVYDVDFDEKQVYLRRGRGTGVSAESYDFLIISVGAEPSFFGIPGAEEHSFTVNSLESALSARRKLDELAQAQAQAQAQAKHWHWHCAVEGGGGAEDRSGVTEDRRAGDRSIDVVIAGAGLTGVEVAGEVVDFLRGRGACRIVEMMPRVLPAMPEKVSRRVAHMLARRGVEMLTGHAVQSVREDEIELRKVSSSESVVLHFDMLIWTAGLKPNRLSERISAPKVRGWLKTDDYLRVYGFEDVYAIGDIAHFERASRTSGKNAEEAERQGKAAAENIARALKGKPLKEYTPKNTVQNPRALISVGGNEAIAYFNGILFTCFAYRIKKHIERKFMRKFGVNREEI